MRTIAPMKVRLVSGAAADQGINAAARLAFIAVASHLLTATPFRDLAVGLALVGFIFMLSSAFWAQPAEVFMNGRFRDRQRAYIVEVLVATTWSGAALAPIVWVLTAPTGPWPLPAGAAVAIIATGIAWSGAQTVRQTAYATNDPVRAMYGNIAGLLVFLAIILALDPLAGISAVAVLWAICAAYGVNLLITAALCWRRLSSGPRARAGEILSAHWQHGRWTTLGMGAYWLGSGGLLLLAARLLTDSDLGSLRVSITYVGLLSILIAVYSSLTTPRIASLAASQGDEAAVAAILRTYRWGLPLIMSAALATLLVGAPLMSLLFGAGQYPGLAVIAVLLGYQVLFAAVRPLTIVVRCVNRPRLATLAHGLGAVAGVGVVIPLAQRLDVVGVALSYGAVAVVLMASMTVAVLRLGRTQSRSNEATSGSTPAPIEAMP